jgi:predicted glycogen debranching enzyme
LRPIATWHWRVGRALLEQEIWMPAGQDATFVQYRLLEGPTSAQISLRPLCTSRHFHHLTRYQDMGPPTVNEKETALEFHWSGGRPSWQISHNGTFKSRPDWYYQFVLTEEAARGYDSTQDLFMPGVISAELTRGDKSGLIVAAATETLPWTNWQQTRKRIDERTDSAASDDPLALALTRAADDFVVRSESGRPTIIAGYPWFGDWGRDTFISLPGLCLVTGRFDDARAIIDSFSKYVDGGMIPNCFPDYGNPPQYNTADASLWYTHAIDRYLAYTQDWEFIADQMFDVVAAILDAHEKGTRHGIALRDDGLLAAGEDGVALTWMDACTNGKPVTPRIGKPVEINALWFNALRIGSQFAARCGDKHRAEHWLKIATTCAESFNRDFWNSSRGCLYDVVDVDHQADHFDGSVRPNQLLAVSLTHPVLQPHRWRGVVDVCQTDLWTPLGLRTLSPTGSAYCGRYSGDTLHRDSVYHQGTVWPWLLGPFVTAYIKAFGNSPNIRRTARRFLSGLEAHLLEAGIGSISEVADGDLPHHPGGCPWQAWSVAEPLRALIEEVLECGPREIASRESVSRALTTAQSNL